MESPEPESNAKSLFLVNENSLEKHRNQLPFSKPAHVSRIIVYGLKRTKSDVITDGINYILRSRSYADVLLETIRLKERLQESRCFKSVVVSLDQVTKNPGDEIVIVVDVEEKQMHKGSGQLSAGNNAGTAKLEFGIANVGGRGESIVLDYGHDTDRVNSFDLTVKKPYLSREATTELSAQVFKTGSQCTYSNWKQDLLGAMMKINLHRRKSYVNHWLIWAGEFRTLRALSNDTPFEIRKHAGQSMKSSFKYELIADTRNRRIFPTSGAFVKFTNELAGFGGNIGFLKHESKVQTNLFFDPLLFQLNFNYGFLAPFQQDEQKIELTDQFFVGGPTFFRGFQTKGIGNRTMGPFLGNNMYYLLSANLLTPLPYQPKRLQFSDSLKLQFFSTIGSGEDRFIGNDSKDVIKSLILNSRMTYGIGLALKFATILQIELNYCWPCFAKTYDRPVQGFQFGFNFHY